MGILPPHWSPRRTLKKLKNADAKLHRRFDNHFQSMTKLVPEPSKAFKVENGLHDLVIWLDNFVGRSETELQISRENTGVKIPLKSFSKLFSRKHVDFQNPDKQLKELIFDNYRPDFERFGYELAAQSGYRA